jgi:hypothetical protein
MITAVPDDVTAWHEKQKEQTKAANIARLERELAEAREK